MEQDMQRPEYTQWMRSLKARAIEQELDMESTLRESLDGRE